MVRVGVYVHIPFCHHRCDYCAFATYTDRDHLMERYVDACVSEIAAARQRGPLAQAAAGATSVFFGGGTPSRLPADELCRILDAIPTAEGAEITVECNPEDATAERLATYRGAGVTRMSFGVQSTRPHVLRSLGRRHGSEHVAGAAAAVVDTGFASWNIDLIFGGAGESDADWQETLGDVLGLATPPPHVSAYALTIEPGTPLAADQARHPDDDVQAGRYEMTERALSAAGYRWEEISNWALPGHQCRHNQLYWEQGDYVGIGSAAHSHHDGCRWWNVRTPDRYMAAMAAGSSPVAGEEHLDGAQRQFEALSLALRTPGGVPAENLPADPDLDDLVEVIGDRKVLTVPGRLLANAVTARLLCPPGAPAHPEDPGPVLTNSPPPMTMGSRRVEAATRATSSETTRGVTMRQGSAR